MSASPQSVSGEALVEQYQCVRLKSLTLCDPLEVEDYQVQPMADASPPKWHLAHVTWFFETFLLKPRLAGYEPYHPAFETLFNSYYNGVGQPFARAKRGFLSRPTLTEVKAYRTHVDAHMLLLMEAGMDDETSFRIELGLHHEQQHQELIVTDLKYNLGNNPLKPAYQPFPYPACPEVMPGWLEFVGGLVRIGADTNIGFVFDNETPGHDVYLRPFKLATHPVSNGEFMEFVEAGGYDRADLWLSDGWAALQALGRERWQMPLYWRREGDVYITYTLGGEQVVDPNQPVCHISGYEADAYARFRGCRLPLEAEWEHAVGGLVIEGNFAESGLLHPGPQARSGASGFYGDVWEWTASSYGPYPGYQPYAGQLGEYNGKFMANQLVLRGGSCASAMAHIRPTYRNFFYPPDRWQFSGVRLAMDTDT